MMFDFCLVVSVQRVSREGALDVGKKDASASSKPPPKETSGWRATVDTIPFGENRTAVSVVVSSIRLNQNAACQQAAKSACLLSSLVSCFLESSRCSLALQVRAVQPV